MYKISVILCTYNSPLNKIVQSLYSVLRQDMDDYEIIIADDGSEENYAVEIERFFQRNGFRSFKLLFHKENKGTVLNLYDAVQKAEGEYIFSVGPGDFVYKKNVFTLLYDSAKKRKGDIIIGDLRFYSNSEGRIKYYKRFAPNFPQIFNICSALYFIPRLLMFYQNNPVGVTYFWKRETIQKYLKEIAGKIVYMEDKSTTLLYLFDNKQLRYYNKPIVWYEFGTGISTSKDKNWERLLDKDEFVLKDLLLKKHPRSRILNAVYTEEGCGKLRYLDIYILIRLWKIFIRIRSFCDGIPDSDKNEILSIINMENDKQSYADKEV